VESSHIDFDSLLNHHKDMIYNLLFRLTGNHNTSEDLFQETFIRVYRGLKSFKGESQISTWLYSIAVNVFRDHKRKNMRNPLESSIADISEKPHADTHAPNPETQVLADEEKNRIQRHINSLKESMKIPLILHYIEGISIQKIAEITGRTPGSIKISLFRARNILKSKWGNAENEKKQHS
jgi:RNA polymerase sigma factor (sigma-70 family)